MRIAQGGAIDQVGTLSFEQEGQSRAEFILPGQPEIGEMPKLQPRYPENLGGRAGLAAADGRQTAPPITPLGIAALSIRGENDHDRIPPAPMENDGPAAADGLIVGMRGQDQNLAPRGRPGLHCAARPAEARLSQAAS